MDAHTDVGPMIRERQVRIVESHVEDAKQRGARVLAGGCACRNWGRTTMRPLC